MQKSFYENLFLKSSQYPQETPVSEILWSEGLQPD